MGKYADAHRPSESSMVMNGAGNKTVPHKMRKNPQHPDSPTSRKAARKAVADKNMKDHQKTKAQVVKK